MPQRKHTSIGEMISSACFFCSGLWLMSEAMVTHNTMKATVLATCGILSFLATFRFRIGRYYDDQFDRDDD